MASIEELRKRAKQEFEAEQAAKATASAGSSSFEKLRQRAKREYEAERAAKGIARPGVVNVNSTSMTAADLNNWRNGLQNTFEKGSAYLSSDGYAPVDTALVGEIDKQLTQATDVMKFIRANGDRNTAAAFSQTVDGLRQLKQAIESKNNTLNQFESEDDYNAAVREAGYFDKYAGMEYDALRDAKYKLDTQSEEYRWLSKYAMTAVNSGNVDGAIRSVNREIDALYKFEEEYGDLERWYNDYQAGNAVDSAEDTAEKLAMHKAIVERFGSYAGIRAMRRAKQAEKEQLEEIKAYGSLRDNADFESMSGVANTEMLKNGLFDFGMDNPYYNYINDLEGTRSKVKDVPGDNPFSRFDDMTEEEIANYNYLYNTQGEKAAMAYLESDMLTEALNQRVAQTRYKAMQGNTGKELLFAIQSGLDQFGSGVNNLFNTEDYYIPATATQQAAALVREDLAKNGAKLPEWLGGASLGQAAFDAISTVSNMAPSILASTAVGLINPAAGAAVGSGLLGASAAGNAYTEMLNQGYSSEEARLYGVAVGVSEVVMERALGGISKLGGNALSKTVLKNFAHVDNVLTRFAKSAGGRLLAGASSEALEEGLQSIIEPYLRYAAAQDKTEISVDMQEALYSALMGFATGGLFEAVDVDTYRRNDGSTDQETKAYRMTEASVREQNKAELSKTLQEKGYSKKQADQIAEAAVSSAAGWRLTEKQQSIWSAAQSDPDVVAAVKDALTGEDSGVRRRNQMSEEFRQGVRSGNKANSQTVVNATPKKEETAEEAVMKEVRRQMRENGLPVEEASVTEDPSTALRSDQDDSVSRSGDDLTSVELREQMQEAFQQGEITEEEYDDYLDAMMEQQGLDGVVEEEAQLREKAEAVKRAEEQVTVQAYNDSGNMNGGTDNGTGVLHGSSQRNDRASAGEPAGGLAGRAGQDQARGSTKADRARETVYRQNLKQNLRDEPAVSSRSQGVQSGTDNATFKVVPEDMHSAKMREDSEDAYRRTGKRITYVVGPIEVVGKDGKVHNAKGVTTDDGILVRIDHGTNGDRIAEHEVFHGLMDLWDESAGRRTILDGLMDELRQRYDPEQLRQMLNQYKEALRGIYSEDSGTELAGDVLEDVDYDVLEEMLADAYAGLNEHGAGANRLTDTVRTWLRENHVEQDFFQDNGTEQPTGPPAGQKENTADFGGERYSLNANAKTELHKALYDIKYRNEVLLRDNSPSIMVAQRGVADRPMAMKASHIRENVFTKQEAMKLGLPVSDDINYHGLGEDFFLKIIDGLDNVKEAYRGTKNAEKAARRENYFLLVSEFKDADGNTINVPVYIDEHAQFNRVFIEVNKISTVFGKKNFRDYISRQIRNGNLVRIKNRSNQTSERSAPIAEGYGKGASIGSIRNQIENVKQQIQAVLDKVSPNHAAQMERYTELKDSNPYLAQKYYDGLMDSPYSVQFEEYLKLTEELARLDSEGSAITEPENDKIGAGFVERASVDDSVAEDDGERIATPAAQARNDQRVGEQAQGEEEVKNSYSTLPAKARDYVRSAERNLLDFIGQALSVPKAARRDFLAQVVRAITNEYLTNGSVSAQTIDGLFQQAYAQGVVADEEFFNQYMHIKDHLRSTAVTLAEQDRSDIADFTDFKRRAGGLLKIRNEGGLPVDVAYQELQDMAPELFPDNITHPADQLVRMLEVAQSIEVSYMSLDRYYGDDATNFKRDARHEFENAVDKVLGDLRNAKRYMDDRNAERDKAPTTVEEAMEAWKELKAARRNYEKTMAKNLLTEHDQRIVGDLLYGKATLENLDPERDNVKGITAVYEAKREYAKLVSLLAEYKRNLKAELRAEADSLLETANEWKDKGSGLAYSRETMRRNVLDIVKDPEVADKILRKYFEPVAIAEATATRFKDKYRERVEALNLSRKVKKGDTVSEAHAVQLLGEAMDNIAVIESARGRLKHRDGKTLTEWKAVVQELWESSPSLDRAKIEKAVQEFREIYDDLFQQMNQVRVQNGYEPVNYRKGYFPHFQKESTDGILAHFGRALGISTEVAALPTTINGLTHTFRPGIQWFGNALQRTGFATAYDAVEGFDKYIEGVASVIHQTENIQRLRALASQIRYRTSDDGIRKQVDDILKDDRLSEEEKQAKIEDLYSKNPRFTLANFVVELDEYTNLLANKKSSIDRNMERFFKRKSYNFAKWLEQRIAANMIAGNLSSALTNVIPLTQAAARMGNINMAIGMWKTVWSYVQDDGMVETSTFLTNRRGSDPLVQIWQDKVSSIVGLPMELIDQFVADSIVRGAYYKNLQHGLTEDEAMRQADLFAASVMADRSKGAMPTIFAAQNPFTKVFTMFQLEVNNQFSEVFKDMPREMRSKGKLALAAKLLQYVLGAFLFNELFEALFGRRPALDPIGILNETIGDFSGYELPNLLELGVGAVTGDMPSFETETAGVQGIFNLGENILGELPFNSIFGFVGIGEDSRIPVESALPDVKKMILASANTEWAAEKRLRTLADEVAKPVTYLALPFGGNQLSKTVKGVIAAVQGGSYTVNNKGRDILQYPVFDDPFSVLRAAILGKNSVPEGQDWVDDGFDSLSAKATATYQGILDVGVDDREAYALVDELRHAKKTDGKTKENVQRDILRDSDISAEAKVVAYCGMVATESELKWMNRLLELNPDAQSVFDVAVGLKEADALKGDAVRQARAEAIADTALTEAQKIVAVESFIENEWQNEDGKPTTYAKFRDMLEAGLTVDDFMELYAAGLDSSGMDKFLKYVDSGLNANEAAEMLKSVSALKPAEGKTTVSNVQKWRAAVDSQSGVDDQLTALSTVMDEKTYQKVELANGYGVKPDAYVGLREILPKYDEDGNSSYNQKEIAAAVNAVGKKMNLTTEQKAVLWQIMASTKSAKNNPYSVEIGWKVVDALSDETLSFGEMFMRQVMAGL